MVAKPIATVHSAQIQKGPDYKITQDDGVFPVLTKNWKMGGLGHWRHLHSSEPPPNGAPASYLWPGWHDRPPRVGKGLNKDGDLGEK